MPDPTPDRPAPTPFLAWLLTSPSVAALATVVLAASVLLPLDGLGVDMCPFYSLTHLPCPGCGLTRSLIHLGHLDLDAALDFHPFGPLVLLGGLATLLNVAAGARWRLAVRQTLSQRPALTRRLLTLLLATFLLFGLARLLAVTCGLAAWPP